MTEEYGYFDPVETAPGVFDREYNADEFTEIFKMLVTTGVMKGFRDELEVSTDSTNMQTIVAEGWAFVEDRYYSNKGPLSHTHDTEVLGRNRIDRIVIRRDKRTEARWVRSFVIKGSPATDPLPPELTRNEQVYEISLAQVYVTGGQTYITSITDERKDEEVCGYAGSNILPNFDQGDLEAIVDKVNEVDSKASKDIHPIVELVLENDWDANIAGYEPKIYKDDMGRVYISGWVRGGTATKLTTIPMGYRPQGKRIALVNGISTDNQLATYIEVDPNGDLRFGELPLNAVLNFSYQIDD